MLNISEFRLVEILKLADGEITQPKINAYLKKEDEPGFEECPREIMGYFLNGLIYYKRGRDNSLPPLILDLPTNNIVLKKLRVAFELKDEDILQMMKNVGFEISKSELSAFFRKEGHLNYRQCGDQFLRNFLKGLTQKLKN